MPNTYILLSLIFIAILFSILYPIIRIANGDKEIVFSYKAFIALAGSLLAPFLIEKHMPTITIILPQLFVLLYAIFCLVYLVVAFIKRRDNNLIVYAITHAVILYVVILIAIHFYQYYSQYSSHNIRGECLTCLANNNPQFAAQHAKLLALSNYSSICFAIQMLVCSAVIPFYILARCKNRMAMKVVLYGAVAATSVWLLVRIFAVSMANVNMAVALVFLVHNIIFGISLRKLKDKPESYNNIMLFDMYNVILFSLILC